MLKLHGFPFSNYHNVVKCVLLEKGIEFEEVVAYPPADEAWLAMNPTGKFPCLELDDGSFLGETKVIMNYLEEAHPRPRLLPQDPLERARVRELMEVIDLYLELVARRLYRGVFTNSGTVDQGERDAVRPLLDDGVRALLALAKFDPYIAGSELTLADFSAAFHFVPVSIASERIYGEDVLAAHPQIAAHRAFMDTRPVVASVREQQLADESRFMQRPTRR